jgi:hypothetical protein
MDTKSCAHLVSNMQGLRDSGPPSKGEVMLKVENGASISTVTVGTLDLHLCSDLCLSLKDIYHVPSIF